MVVLDNLKYMVGSFGAAITAMLGIKVVEMIILLLTGYIMDYNGAINLEGLNISMTLNDWNIVSVLLLYLLPFGVLVTIFLFLNKPFYYPIKLSRSLLTIKTWAYQLLLIQLTLGSAINILTKQGLFYPLNWLGVTLFEQYIISALLLLVFIIGSLKMGKYWAPIMHIDGVVIYDKPQLSKQLLYYVVLPSVVLAGVMFSLSGLLFNAFSLTYIVGLFITSGVIFIEVRGYDVVVR